MLISVIFLEVLLQCFSLLRRGASDFDVHAGSFDWKDTLELVDDGKGLLLGSFGMDHFAVDFLHSFLDDGARELILVLCVDALLADPVGNIELHLLELVVTFQL